MNRSLKLEEVALLRSMLESTCSSDLLRELDGAIVYEMKDGGMGSLRFVQHGATEMGRVLCEAESNDSDNVPLQISINLDQHGHLFELDMWKVDFSPLLSYPAPSTLRFLDPKP